MLRVKSFQASKEFRSLQAGELMVPASSQQEFLRAGGVERAGNGAGSLLGQERFHLSVLNSGVSEAGGP